MRICVLARSSDLRWFRSSISDLSIRNRWPDCEICGNTRLAEWNQSISSYGFADVIFCDVIFDGAIDSLKTARKFNPAALVVPIASSSVSPASYVRPEILPYALLWHPIEGPENRDILYRILSHVFSEKAAPEEQLMTIRSKRESRQIPYSEICYFEAREKRVYVHLHEQEIVMNETISSLEQRLPAQFFRCHKGFLVNGALVESVDWSIQLINLKWGLSVPLSRGYRAAVKERINGTS